MPEPIRITIDPDLAELIPPFLEHRCRDAADLRVALAGADFPAIREIGHMLKGTGGGFGFMAITDLGRAFDLAAKAQDSEALRALLDEFDDFLARVEVVYAN